MITTSVITRYSRPYAVLSQRRCTLDYTPRHARTHAHTHTHTHTHTHKHNNSTNRTALNCAAPVIFISYC